MNDVIVLRDDQASRYTALVDGEIVGRIDFSQRDGVVNLLHVEVDSAHRGKGVASTLVRHALDDVRAQSMQVIPTCPYARQWLKAHPDYADLVAS